MEIVSTVTRKQYFIAHWRSLLFALVFTIILGMMIVFLIGLVFKDPIIKILWIGVPLGILVFYLFLYTQIFTSKENRQRLFTRRQFVIDENGVTVTAGEFQRTDSWGAFTFWNEANDWVNILSKNNNKTNYSLIIPKTDMTKTQSTEFNTLLMNKIGMPGRLKKIQKN